MTVFAGIDLAWKPGRESGICILEGDGSEAEVRCLEARAVAPEELAEMLRVCGPDVVAAIDAPLLLGEGRTADRLTAVAYGRYHAAPYTPSPAFLARSGMAGPNLAAALEARGFSFDVTAPTTGRLAIEVFPHTCHVELFRLQRRLAYKKGVLAARRAGTIDYALRLTAFLAARIPAMAEVVGPLAAELAASPGGRALKHIEDQLDALTCAYTAWHVHAYGPPGVRIFGDWRTGAIVVPVLPAVLPATSAPARSCP